MSPYFWLFAAGAALGYWLIPKAWNAYERHCVYVENLERELRAKTYQVKELQCALTQVTVARNLTELALESAARKRLRLVKGGDNG